MCYTDNKYFNTESLEFFVIQLLILKVYSKHYNKKKTNCFFILQKKKNLVILCCEIKQKTRELVNKSKFPINTNKQIHKFFKSFKFYWVHS